MKLFKACTLAVLGLSLASAVSAQTSTGWGAKPAASSSGSLPNSRSKPMSSLPGNTLTSGGQFGTPAGTTQNSMISHNHRVRFSQRHTDANNPLLHPQQTSTPGLLSPTPMSPMSSPMSPMSTSKPMR